MQQRRTKCTNHNEVLNTIAILYCSNRTLLWFSQTQAISGLKKKKWTMHRSNPTQPVPWSVFWNEFGMVLRSSYYFHGKAILLISWLTDSKSQFPLGVKWQLMQILNACEGSFSWFSFRKDSVSFYQKFHHWWAKDLTKLENDWSRIGYWVSSSLGNSLTGLDSIHNTNLQPPHPYKNW